MTDQEIADAVQAIVSAIPNNKQATGVEAAAIAAGVELVTNLLQNINTIAMMSKHPPYAISFPDTPMRG